MPADQLTATGNWWQAYLEFNDWSASEQIAAEHLAPLLHQAEADGLISAWWFMRKHPCWRLRFQREPDDHQMKAFLSGALDTLAADGAIRRWWPGLYEAEEAAFGGPEGMTAAHGLFSSDSRGVMSLLAGAPLGLGRRELAVILASTLMQSAGLEWYEQGDIWHHVARERPQPPGLSTARLATMSEDIRALMLADATPGSGLLEADGPLAAAADWVSAFRDAGQTIGAYARTGLLQRGLREVLSYHVIFHWNRLGLPARQQSILAWSARNTILGTPPAASSAPAPATRSPQADPAIRALEHAVARFPLVPRPKLSCPDLQTRIRQVRDYAAACCEPADPEKRVDQACTALNQAALIAADCGMPGLATDLCHRQFTVFQSTWPVSGRTTIACLQPLVNLARLDIRAGQPEGACRLLRQVDQAISNGGGSVSVHGKLISLNGFADATGRTIASTWFRDVLLYDGTRALVATGNWDQAAEHAARLDDAPERLGEGRQARVIAAARNGDAELALSLLDETTHTEPWERVVMACLRLYTYLITRRPIPVDTGITMTAKQQVFDCSIPGVAVFRIRLALTAAELARATGVDDQHLITHAATEACSSGDAQAAREVLMNPAARDRLTPGVKEELASLIDWAYLGQGRIPHQLIGDLTASVDIAETVLAKTLARP
jgi:thiopeptide-type bacteriocin biosynthesis protein